MQVLNLVSQMQLNEKIVLVIEVLAIINVLLSIISQKVYKKVLNVLLFFLPQKYRVNLIDEIPRKQFHLMGAFSTIILKYTPYKLHKIVSQLIIALGIIVYILEQIRLHNQKINDWFFKNFSALLRPKERNQPTGTYPLFLGCGLTLFISLTLYPNDYVQIVTYAYISLFFGDAAASLIGKTFGKHKIGQKSLEGVIANFIVNYIFSKNIFIGIAACLTELSCGQIIKIDDNLLIPITSAVYYCIYLKIKQNTHL